MGTVCLWKKAVALITRIPGMRIELSCSIPDRFVV